MIELYDFSFFIYRSMGIEKSKNGVFLRGGGLASTLEIYQHDIHQVISFPFPKCDETLKKNNYELEIFSRLACEYESLEPIEQQEFKEKFKELLQVRRDHSVAKISRREFLEDREVLFPLTFWYQNNTYKQPYLPRKASLEAFYDTYLKGS